jgi:hypothetical protein
MKHGQRNYMIVTGVHEYGMSPVCICVMFSYVLVSSHAFDEVESLDIQEPASKVDNSNYYL